MNKKLFSILMLFFIVTSQTSIYANQDRKNKKAEQVKKYKKKRCKKQDQIASHISMIRQEFEKLEANTTKENLKSLLILLDNLEHQAVEKLSRYEQKLEDQKNLFNQPKEEEDSNEEYEINRTEFSDKMASYESKINCLKEAMTAIQELKMKIKECKKNS